MDENNSNSVYDLDEILAEFRSPAPTEKKKEEKPRENVADHSRRLIMRSMDDAFGLDAAEINSAELTDRKRTPVDPQGTVYYRPESLSPAPEESPADETAPEPAGADAEDAQEYTRPFTLHDSSNAPHTAVDLEEKAPKVDLSELTGVYHPVSSHERKHAGTQVPPEAAEAAGDSEAPAAPNRARPSVRRPRSELNLRELVDADEAAQYAAAGAEESGEAAEESAARSRAGELFRERVLAPLTGLLALIALRRSQRAAAPAAAAEAPKEEPEPTPVQASRACAAEMGSLRFRGRVSAGACLVMLYLSVAYFSKGLPLTGALGSGVRCLSLLLMIFELTVMLAGLDLFTEGLLNIVRRRPGLSSLISVSCVLTVLDAAVIAIADKPDWGLPFCAVSAISMCCGLWGRFYRDKGRRAALRLSASGSRSYAVRAEDCGVGQNGEGGSGAAPSLLKRPQKITGFVRGTLAPDRTENAYAAVAPFLLIAAAVLGLLSSLARGRPGAVLHCVAILEAVTATFSAPLSYALPFSSLARRLSQSGAAIAGWTGLEEVGRCRSVVITDGDLFPKGTVQLGPIRLLEGAFTNKVLSYTGSVIAASGSGLSEPFAEMLRRHQYPIHKVENFEAHDGGGMTAMVSGESVYVGGAGFMNLMGIRLPQRLSTQNSLFTAINGSLVGIFTVEYQPTSSVQDALVVLLRSRYAPVFAIRDCNITPALLGSCFRLPQGSLKFPSYAERYRISAMASGEDGTEEAGDAAAVVMREGLGPVVEISDRGYRTRQAVRICTAISLFGSAVGLLILFLLCWTGAFDSASVSNVLFFMLLWLLPMVPVLIGLGR